MVVVVAVAVAFQAALEVQEQDVNWQQWADKAVAVMLIVEQALTGK
jgi:hypothetical protein